MRSLATYVLIAAAFAGCATATTAYDKPGASDMDRRRDVGDCTQLAIGHEPGRHVLLPVVVDRDVMTKCLEARGYSRMR